MKKINIIDTFSLNSFQKEHDNGGVTYEVKAAMFLTYSLEPKVILALLSGLFPVQTNDDEEADTLINKVVDHVLEHKAVLKSKFAVFYNNGSRAVRDRLSILDTVAMQFAYPVDMCTASFHPKVCIVKYGPKGSDKNAIYRIMIGSRNLSISNAIEYGYCFDRKAEDRRSDNNNCWGWLSSLLTPSGESEDKKFFFMDQNGKKLDIKSLPVFEEITKCNISDGLPEILTSFDGFSAGVIEVFSPFVTVGKTDAAKRANAKIYTTAFELKKRGFEPIDENAQDEAEAQEFWIFAPKEGSDAADYAMPHYKVYLLKDENNNETAYVGSLNYTESALRRNKEILVEVPKEQIEAFRNKVHGGNWYIRKKYKKAANRDEEAEADVYENFKNWIRKNLSSDKLAVEIKKDGGICVSVKLCGDTAFERKAVWEEIRPKAGSVPDAFTIRMCPQGLTNERNIWDREPKEWSLKQDQMDKLTSSAICFYLNDGEREYPPYCREYPVNKGSEILKERTELALDIGRIRLILTGESESTGGARNGHSVSAASFQHKLSIYSLKDLLGVEPEKRKARVKKMRSKIDMLNRVLESIKSRDAGALEKTLLSFGCVPADQLVWEKLIEQGNEMIKHLDTIEDTDKEKQNV